MVYKTLFLLVSSTICAAYGWGLLKWYEASPNLYQDELLALLVLPVVYTTYKIHTRWVSYSLIAVAFWVSYYDLVRMDNHVGASMRTVGVAVFIVVIFNELFHYVLGMREYLENTISGMRRINNLLSEKTNDLQKMVEEKEKVQEELSLLQDRLKRCEDGDNKDRS